MDAFYVSVERRENPDLANKPVIVGADPKGGKGRGVVMASSYEARQIGIRSGMPIGMAWRKAPTATYLRPNYELYGAVSESVMNVLRSYADILEHVSIDEAFLDVTSKVRDFDGAAGYAARVKAAVREREGLACTIGAGPNKSVAKIASDLAKPDGLKVVRPEEVTRFLDQLPVTKISGVGVRTAQLLERSGVRTIGELARFPGRVCRRGTPSSSRGRPRHPPAAAEDETAAAQFVRVISGGASIGCVQQRVDVSGAAARRRSGRAAERPCRSSTRPSSSRTARGPSSPAGGPRRCTSGRPRSPSADRGTRNHQRTAPS